jgi:hypothetical protein
MSYEDWLVELKRIMWLLSGRVEGPDFSGDFERYDPGLDREAWRGYFNEGLTPAQAFMEDCAYA